MNRVQIHRRPRTIALVALMASLLLVLFWKVAVVTMSWTPRGEPTALMYAALVFGSLPLLILLARNRVVTMPGGLEVSADWGRQHHAIGDLKGYVIARSRFTGTRFCILTHAGKALVCFTLDEARTLIPWAERNLSCLPAGELPFRVRAFMWGQGFASLLIPFWFMLVGAQLSDLHSLQAWTTQVQAGLTVQRQGDLVSARRHYERSLEMISHQWLDREPRSESTSLLLIACTYHRAGDTGRAVQIYTRARSLAAKVHPRDVTGRLVPDFTLGEFSPFPGATATAVWGPEYPGVLRDATHLSFLAALEEALREPTLTGQARER